MNKMNDNLREKNIFITGATGLLGSHLIETILNKNKYDVNLVALIRDRIPTSYLWTLGDRVNTRLKVVYGDIRDFELVKRTINEYEIDLVFHIAAQAIVGTAKPNPRNTIDVNVMGTVNVLEAVNQLRSDTKVIVASSDKAYIPLKNGDKPYTENDRLQGVYTYDVSKSCADLIAQSYGHTYNINVAITRCGNLYGPGDANLNRLIPGTIWSYLHGKAPIIRSDGKAIRDYIFVEDAVSGYLLIADKLLGKEIKPGSAFNISTGNHLSVLEVVDSIKNILDPNGLVGKPIILDKAKDEVAYQTLSSDKMKKLGWKPEYDWEESLRITTEWYTSLMEIDNV